MREDILRKIELNARKITITSYVISMTSIIFDTMFDRNILGSSSEVLGETSEIFGEHREISDMFGNVHMTFGQHLENLLKIDCKLFLKSHFREIQLTYLFIYLFIYLFTAVYLCNPPLHYFVSLSFDGTFCSNET